MKKEKKTIKLPQREIKFRAYSKLKNKWVYFVIKPTKENIDQTISFGSTIGQWLLRDGKLKNWGEYTGLKDKNGLIDIYEGDIIDKEGNIIGNQYENPGLLKEKTNLLIQGFGTKTWYSTYKKAMDRGCQDAQ